MPYHPRPTVWTCEVEPAHEHKSLDAAKDCVRRHEVSAPFGFCPVCWERGESRSKVEPSADVCSNGHSYPSAESVALEDIGEVG